MFRALRSKEDPRNGLQPFSRTANVNVGADHVENGSHIETQYISMTGRLAVAVYFAARGYHERGHANPRIGVFGASASRMEQFYAEEMVGNNRTAGNFARAFDEYIFTEVEAERYLALQYIIHIRRDHLDEFEGNTFVFRDFLAQYNASDLQALTNGSFSC